MKNANIVILAGGISSRMKASSDGTAEVDMNLQEEARRKSKAMISIGIQARPFLDYILYNTQAAGYHEVVIVVNEHDPSIREYYEGQNGAHQFDRLSISYATQKIPAGRKKPLGTADALLEALATKPSWHGESFTVCNSDNLYSVNALRALLENKHANAMIDYDRTTLRFPEERIAAFAVIKKDSDGSLLDIIEKPGITEIEQMKDSTGRIGISMNIFKLSYDLILPILQSIPLHPIRQEKELPLAVRKLVEQHPGCVTTIPCSEHVVDLTSQSDIPYVQQYLKTHFPDFSAGLL
jgi:NDP-sugar pyrophosphorylase family protein